MKRALFVGILCLAAFLRLYRLDVLPPDLSADESMNGSNALENIENHSFKVFYPENFGREGLFINIQTIFVELFGSQPCALRLSAANYWSRDSHRPLLTGKQTILTQYRPLGRLFLATSYWNINFSRIGLRVELPVTN